MLESFMFRLGRLWRRIPPPLQMWVVLAIIGGAILGWNVGVRALENFFPETPEEHAAVAASERHERESEQYAAESARRHQEMRLICEMKDTCRAYGEARQQCAVAGNYRNCLRVKIGYDEPWLADRCTDEGIVLAPPNRIPSFSECLLNKLP